MPLRTRPHNERAPTLLDLTSASTSSTSTSTLPKIHIRTYTLRLLASGVKTPRVELIPMGPNLDLMLRRHQDADPEMMKMALKKPKLKKKDLEKRLGKRNNMEVDDMGDLRGRIHVAKQDLSRMQRSRGLRVVHSGTATTAVVTAKESMQRTITTETMTTNR